MMADKMTELQKLTFQVFKAFISICNENGFTWYLGGGSLIGAVRHKGFIPWDDDIDVVMPRPDYDRFVSLMESSPPEGFSVCTYRNNDVWRFAFCQFVDIRNVVEISLAKKTRTAHVWIDIYPLDGLPDNRMLRFLRMKRIMMLRYLVQLVNIDTQVDAQRTRPFLERAVLRIAGNIPFLSNINDIKILRKLESVLRSFDYSGAVYCGALLGKYREREIMPAIWFGVPEKGLFHGVEVNLPKQYDSVLRSLHGDYMVFPKETERENHNVRIVK